MLNSENTMKLAREEIDKRRQKVFAKYGVTDFVVENTDINYNSVIENKTDRTSLAGLIGCGGILCNECTLNVPCRNNRNELADDLKAELSKPYNLIHLKLRSIT